MLPYLNNKSGMRAAVRTGFRGLNHNLSAGDGEIYDMKNMSSREYPLMTQRQPMTGDWSNVGVDMGTDGSRLFFVSVPYSDPTTCSFYYGAINSLSEKGTVTRTKKQFLIMGSRILIFPDKKYYDTKSDYFGSMEKTQSGTISFKNGEYQGASADANTLYCGSFNWGFQPGDAVAITGCVTHPENNKTAIVREVSGHDLRFYENTFTLDSTLRYTAPAAGLPAGTYHFEEGQFTISTALTEGDTLTWNGTGLDAVIGGVSSTVAVTEGTGGTALVFSDIPTDYTEAGTVTVSRTLPDIDFYCVFENRLWGCKGDTIYASALGDPFNFNVFDGLSTDSWSSSTQGGGNFTGCASYGGHPIFFKENVIVKVQGDKPANFQWTLNQQFGVKAGCERSLAVAGEVLFYLSPAGICAYNGGNPRVISEALGVNTKWYDAVGGSDGIRYYVSMKNKVEANFELIETNVYVYDTRYGEWFREDNAEIRSFVYYGGLLYRLNLSREIHPLLSGDGVIEEEAVLGTDASAVRRYGEAWEGQEWSVEFADSTRFYETTDTGSQDKKGPLRLQLRCSMSWAATISVYIQYDSDGQWVQAGYLTRDTGGSGKKTYILPLIIRRCDHYRIKLSGVGKCVIYSLTEVKYNGSNLQGGTLSTPPAAAGES